MTVKTLFLAWYDKRSSQAWFPVGRLDIEPECHRFRYIGGARRAKESARFNPLLEFPYLDKCYESSRLFALFRNRVIARGRPNREEYLRWLGLPADAEPFEILSISGGRRVTDPYEVFPRLVKSKDGDFKCRFFLHGWHRADADAQDRLEALCPREELRVDLDLTNPVAPVGVRLMTADNHVVGWPPRYLEDELVRAMPATPTYKARVVRVNSLHGPSLSPAYQASPADGSRHAAAERPNLVPVPPRWHVLVEMSGRWTKHEPMTGVDFEPLVG